MIQGKFGNPNGAGQVWASPERDIVNAFPHYFMAAGRALKNDLGDMTPEEREVMENKLVEFIRVVKAFVEGIVASEDIHKLSAETGLVDDKHADAERLFSRWIWRAVISAYYKGVREASHKDEPNNLIPFTQKSLDSVSDSLPMKGGHGKV